MLDVESFLAEGRLRGELTARPDDPALLRELAAICLAKRQAEEACTLLDQLCALPAADAPARNLRIQALRQTGRLAEALTEAEALAAEQPHDYDTVFQVGELALLLNDYQRCATAMYRCCTAKPTDSRAFLSLSAALTGLRRHDDAAGIRCDLMANAMPQLADYLILLADSCRLALRPDDALGETGFPLHVTEASAHHLDGQVDAAIEAIGKAVALAPDDTVATMNHGLMLMAAGRWQEGWPGYEKRLDQGGGLGDRPRWNGQAMAGTLLVMGEQGLGDQVQCLRYLPLIRPLVGRLVVQIADPLLRLAQTIPGIDEWVAGSAPAPAHDCVISMMSLMGLLDQGIPGTAPVPVPFLRPPARANVALPDGGGFKVGLCWAGNPGYAMDSVRSMPASEVARLMRRVPGARYYRLQRGPTAPFVGQLAEDLPILDAVKDCADYADTAAVVDKLDLVITVDTSLAHVAGALGKETWLLLPFVSCFRWGRSGEATALYPNTTLIRQQHRGEGWAEAMDEVALRLAARMTETHPS